MKRNLILLVVFVFLFLVSCEQNNEIKDNFHNILDHEFVQVETIKEATCTETGIKKLSCSCGATIEEKIPMIDHSFEWNVEKEATCAEPGIKKGVCSVCNKEEMEAIVALGHEYVWSTVEATCTEPGYTTYTCSCGDTYIADEVPAIGHSFVDETIVTVSATTTREGSVTNACLNCGEEHVLKIMQTPVVVRNLATLSWEKISGADGYKVYIDNEFYADLGNVSKFNFPLDKDAIYSINVEAYSSNPEYCELSEKSEAVSVDVKHDTINLQHGLGTDFERFNKTYYLNDVWIQNYANFGNGQVLVMKEDDNAFAKLSPTNKSLLSTLTHDASVKILKAGTYVFSMDVKVGSAIDGAVSFRIYDGKTWTWDKAQVIDISSANSQDWTTVKCEYVIDADLVGDYAHLEIYYDALVVGNDNYIMVDNIKISTKGSSKNLESGNNYNFDHFYEKMLSTSNWKSDGKNSVVYVSDDSLENGFVTIDDNTVFKAYTSFAKCTSVNFKGNPSIATEGVYELTVRVKGGPDANKLGSIGVRLFGDNSFKVVDVRFDGVENINSEKWTTLKLTFVVKQTKVTDYVNIEFYVYTNNDEDSSPDNYLLVDDLSVYKINIQ